MAAAPGGGLAFLLGRPGAPRPTHSLLTVAEPARARAHLAPLRPEDRRCAATESVRRCAEALRKHLLGRTIAGVRADPGERLVRVAVLAPHGGPAGVVLAELFGPAPAVLLLDPEERVLVTSRTRGGQRPLAPGLRWRPPPSPPRRARASETPPPDAPRDHPLAADAPLSAAVDAWFRPLDLAAERERAFREHRRSLEREIDRLERLLSHLEGQASGVAAARLLRREADLLGVHFTRLPPAGGRVPLTCPVSGETLIVDLVPGLPPAEWIAARHRKARGLERSAAGAERRLPEVRAALDAARSRLAELEELRSKGEPPPPRPSTEPRRGAGTRAARTETRRRRRLPAGVRRFATASGTEVLVGSDATSNDALVTRLARADDIWLHLEGRAGAHVVLRVERGESPTLDDLLDAAALAVHFSSARGAPTAEVTYTPRRNVRKTKRLPPGTVLLTRRRTLRLREAETRARRLLGLDRPPPPSPGGG